MFRELWSRLESSLHGRDLEREMDEEMRFHLAMQVEKNRTEGLSMAEARRLARRDFGGPLQVKEECRDARHTWLDSLWHDVRYALRGFRRDRAFTATVVLTLGLAIGATTSVFTILDNTLFRPLPYDRPDRVVMLMGRSPASGQLFETLGKEQAAALRRGRSLAVVADYSLSSTRLRLQLPGSAEPESIRAAGASADLLAVLGVSTAIGRAFRQDDGAAVGPRAVILTFGFWQRRLGGDRSAIGREIVLKHDSLTELDVMTISGLGQTASMRALVLHHRRAVPSGGCAAPAAVHLLATDGTPVIGPDGSRKTGWIGCTGPDAPDTRRYLEETFIPGGLGEVEWYLARSLECKKTSGVPERAGVLLPHRRRGRVRSGRLSGAWRHVVREDMVPQDPVNCGTETGGSRTPILDCRRWR